MKLFSVAVLATAVLVAPAFADTPSPAPESIAADAPGPGAGDGFDTIRLDLTPQPAGLALLAVGAELVFVWRFRAPEATV